MGGFEDDEPPAKRARASSVESAGLSDSFCFSKSINPLGGTMARPLPSQGKEVMVGSKGVIKRDEFVRIITKALYTLGYEKSGAVLEEESGITLHSPAVNLFRKQVLDGNWDNAVATLNKIGFLDENIVKSAAFFILEQKFFELLRNDNLMGAIKTLQSEITPLDVNRKRVHELSSCVLSSPQNVLLGFSKLGIESSNSRLKLLEELQKVLPPTVMVPERRLENLVEQALTVQREACYFHNSVDGLSLYTDHHCGKDQIPSQTLQVLCAHSDEVWFLQFSNNGKYLASASNDKSAIIWKVDENGELLLKHTLTGHEKPVMMVAWSPDDRQLLTCGMEEAIRRWDVESGECILVYEKPSLGLISCGWFPDGKQILSVLNDQNFCLWDLDGKEVDCWKGQRSKTSDFAVANDGKLIISTSTNRECTILLFDRETKQERLIEEERTITSFSLSEDGDFLLVNLTSQEIHLWNIRNGPIRVQRYTGHKRNRFVIRSCFGGSEQAFIASGSEDSQVYIWHRATGELIEALPGHSGTVNCVSWNPTNPHMLASASDDHTIRIWGVEKASPKLKDIGGGSSNGVHMNGSAHGNGFVHQCNGNRIK